MPSFLITGENIWRTFLFHWKGMWLKWYLAIHGCKVGSGLKVKKWPTFRAIPNKNITIGNNVGIGYNIIFDIHPGANLVLDDRVHLTQNVLISCKEEVVIGKDSGVGEFTSIRDSDHLVKKDQIINKQGVISSPIHIGIDVGIGRGCLILRGATIADGVVIGANCIVARNLKTIPNGIYLGNPPKLISKRI